MPESAITPTIGRKLWLFISPETRRHDWASVVVLDHTQALDASVAFVHPPEKHPEYTYVTITFADHEGRTHEGKVVPLRQPGQKHPDAREWVEWMPYQQGQAKKEAAAPLAASSDYVYPNRREEMLRDLAQGAAITLSNSDGDAAERIGNNILAVVNKLHPQAVLTNPSTGHPRYLCDVASDPEGTLIVPSGARLAAATKAADGDAIEQEIQAKGLTAPRVTPADLQANIASEHYFTAFDGVAGAGYNEASPDGVLRPFTFEGPGSLGLLTFCVLVLRNGFTVTGESACASPENFDAEVGRKIARANAEQKIWPLMGYELRSRLAAPAEPDFLAGKQACSLGGEGACEAFQ